MKKCPTSKARRKKIRNQESVCTVFDQIFSSQRQQIRKKTQRIQHLLKTSKSNSSSGNSKQKIIYTHLKQEDRKIAIMTTLYCLRLKYSQDKIQEDRKKTIKERETSRQETTNKILTKKATSENKII